MAMSCVLPLMLALAAQTPPPADPRPDGLGDRYVDGSYGFALRPPAGWLLNRRRLLDGRETTLLRMRSPEDRLGAAEITVRHKSTRTASDMGRLLRVVGYELELEFPSIEIESQQVQQIAGRKGAFLSATYSAEGVRMLKLEAIVEMAPRNYLLLLCDVPAAARGRVEPVFRHVLGSLELLADPLSERLIQQALGKGAAWLAGLRTDALKRARVENRYFRLDVKGNCVGFMRVRERARRRKKREGVEIIEERWIFEDGGTVRRLQSRMFVSHDLTFERWQASATSWQPAGKGTAEAFENTFEEGLREHDVLATSQAAGLAHPQNQNEPIRVPAAYLSRGLIGMLPRLLGGLERARRIAFLTFDHERAGLIVRVLDLKGACEPPPGISPPDGGLFRIEQREGLASGPSSLYVDGSGRVVLMKAGELVMRPATAKELEPLFADRVREADAAMARLEQRYHEHEARFLRGRARGR